MVTPHSILIVDDDELVALTIKRALSEAGYTVMVAHSGMEAIQQVRRIPPDLMVLDVSMPGIDGYAVCREIRNDSRLSDLPVLFLTARGGEADRIQGLVAGADDYMAKPFNHEELLLRIQAILRRVNNGSAETELIDADTVKAGNVTLNCRTFSVNTAAGEKMLTNVQFDLLYHLMIHAGQIFSTQQLLQTVWNYPPNTGSPELVRAHVRNLREKIEVDPSNPQYVRTVQGHGYAFFVSN